MPTRHATVLLRRMGRLVVALALLLATAGSPLRADSSIERIPLCREDGLCLSAPRLASQLMPGSRTEAPRADEPVTPCETALLVKRETQVTPREFQRLLQRRGNAQIEGLLTPQWWRVCLPTADAAAQGQVMAELMALPEVALVEPDGIAHAAWSPNDPYYDAQWALPTISAPGAWDVTPGSSNAMIAVIDSGVDYLHPDGPQDLWLGWDFVHDTDDPYDDYGHGTHVMGIAAARTNNGVGVAGLCPDCSALGIKVLDYNGFGYWSDVADGIVLATDAIGVLGKRLVINLSLGGTDSYSALVADAINGALAQGAIVIAAAGNYGPAAPMFPAALPGVLAVSATDATDRPSSIPTSVFASQYGDIAAPGSGLYSTVPLWKRTPPYDYLSGTSMATPLVAAAAGLVWSVHPEYSSFQVKLALLKNVDVPGGWNPLYGVGRLNVERAVTAPEIVLKHVYLPLTVR